MGKVKHNDAAIMFHLPAALKAEFKLCCEAAGVDMSEVLVAAIKRFMAEQNEDESEATK